MHWHVDGEPLGRTPDEVLQYVTLELARAAPGGWEVERIPGSCLAWRLVKQDDHEILRQEYDVIVPTSLDFVIFTCGNSDAGPFSIAQALQRGFVIEASVLRYFGMPKCLEFVMSTCKPNTWGLS